MAEAGARHYVLWLINAVQDWNKPALLRALCASSTPERPITAELGDREAPRRWSQGLDINDHEAARARRGRYASITEYTALGALMHEGGHVDRERFTVKRTSHTFDEYFVPIPVKCLGDPDALVARLGHGGGVPAHDRDALGRIIETYRAAYYSPASPTYFKRYWDRGFSGSPMARGAVSEGEVRMHSDAYVGYYEMLVRWNERPGHARDRHILLGYSQGGLVGRFLAHLDEHVFKRGLVHGVVTVQSPNFGSPVARHDNAPELARVLRTVLPRVPWPLVKLFAPLDVKSLVKFLERHQNDIEIDALDDQLRDSIVEIRGRITSGDAVSVGSSQELIDMLTSARKWLSGLCSKRQGPDFAFADLTPERNYLQAASFHVLRCVNESGHVNVPHAAVVGCNPSLRALFGGGLRGALASFVARFFGLSLDTLTREYASVFDETSRLPSEPHESYVRLAECYLRGVAKSQHIDLAFASLAHDCVIPASHQLLSPPFDGIHPKPPPPTFIGNFINLDSNHASGTALTDAPPSCLSHVVRAFEKLPALDKL